MPHRRRNQSPEQRVRQQLQDIQKEVLKGLRAVDKANLNSNQDTQILHQHEQRVRRIVAQGRRKPNRQPVCSVCGKPLMQSTKLWTNTLPLKFLYALSVAGLFVLLAFLAEWWSLLLFPVGWVVSQSFLSTISVPLLLLLAAVLIMSLFEL
jgi:hypothetical protein